MAALENQSECSFLMKNRKSSKKFIPHCIKFSYGGDADIRILQHMNFRPSIPA
jgi:Sec7-like guanine-nucleotide exchange factor